MKNDVRCGKWWRYFLCFIFDAMRIICNWHWSRIYLFAECFKRFIFWSPHELAVKVSVSGITSNFGTAVCKKILQGPLFFFFSLFMLPSRPHLFFSLSFGPFLFLFFSLRPFSLHVGSFCAAGRFGGALWAPPSWSGQSPGRKRVLEHFGAPEAAYGDVRFRACCVKK